MDHPTYLELFHETVIKVLPEVAIRQGRGDHDSAADLVTALRTKLDDLWAQRVVTAQQGMKP
ncbi:hypothetical protein [Phenylobacterium soli]|uniref:Uncharacterized protein n=1 Tax=Phenylobacterium soli TaxID=2170551 RepID=A0A328AAA2_9CAUL|nr:hypothetical protein [Phenylobacterium soli]RAK51602.1 hypothetical protein DJ017_17350 [Phenylobacterium soli]